MELEKICRTCLGFTGPLLSIYDGGASAGNANCIADMLSDVTKMKPKSGDNMPEKVCLSCISEINRCYSFKMKCENSNRTLRQLIPEALPEDELVQKPKVQLVNKMVQTLSSPKKQYKTAEVQTIKLESDAKKPTVLPKPIVKGEARPESPAKRPRLEAKTTQSSITQYTRNTSKRIKQEPLLKDVPMSSEQEFVLELGTLRREEIDLPSSTTTLVQDHANTIEHSNFEIFEEYVYDDENESFNPTNEVNFARLSVEESQDNFERTYPMVKDVELNVINEIDCDSGEQEDEEDEAETIKEHVEYHISICNETDEVKASKEDPNFKRANYQCPHCVMCFVSVKNLNKHVMKRHSMSIVETQTEGQNGKIEEVIEIGMDAPVAPVAPTADSSTEQKKTRKAPPRTKIPDEPEPAVIASTPKVMNYTCEICKASFALRKSLLFHTRLNTCNQKSYSCSECGRVFISEDNLIKHKSTHVLSNACDECHKVFPSKEELSQHMIDEHKRKVRNQCTICMKVFTMLSTLRDHMRTHTGEKPFLCPICGRGFSQNTNLRQHMLRHSDNKPFKCDECPNSYCTKAEYYSHKRTHTGDQPFKCEFCDARFTSNSSMNKHRRKHTGERPYACDLCPMRFACLNVMKNHRRTHTGEKPFKCTFCTKVFTQKGDCLNHQRTHLRGGSEVVEPDKAKRTRSSHKKEENEQTAQEGIQDDAEIASEEEVQDQEVALEMQDSTSSEVEIVELAFE